MKYTRTVYKVQYTLNGVYMDLHDRMTAVLQGNTADIVEHKTPVYTDHSNTLKGFSATIDTSDLISGPYESEHVEIVKNR
jgi:hypothetical protein